MKLYGSYRRRGRLHLVHSVKVFDSILDLYQAHLSVDIYDVTDSTPSIVANRANHKERDSRRVAERSEAKSRIKQIAPKSNTTAPRVAAARIRRGSPKDRSEREARSSLVLTK